MKANKKIRNILLIIMYDGSEYYGWQYLKNEIRHPTIQGTIEHALSVLLEDSIQLIGAGRTDKGVHAYGQTANFLTSSKEDIYMLQKNLNKLLPEDICILSVKEVPNSFHSRYHAVKKIYEYHIDTREKSSVFYNKYRAHIPEPLNLEIMKKAAFDLVGRHDFRGFSSVKNEKDTIREIYNIEIEKKENLIVISVIGNGFLSHMVRIIVGTLIEVGMEKRDRNDIKEILFHKKRELAGKTMESKGLFLKKIFY